MSILDEELQKEKTVNEVYADIWSFCPECQKEWKEHEVYCKAYQKTPCFHWAITACPQHAEQMRGMERASRKSL